MEISWKNIFKKKTEISKLSNVIRFLENNTKKLLED